MRDGGIASPVTQVMESQITPDSPIGGSQLERGDWLPTLRHTATGLSVAVLLSKAMADRDFQPMLATGPEQELLHELNMSSTAERSLREIASRAAGWLAAYGPVVRLKLTTRPQNFPGAFLTAAYVAGAIDEFRRYAGLSWRIGEASEGLTVLREAVLSYLIFEGERDLRYFGRTERPHTYVYYTTFILELIFSSNVDTSHDLFRIAHEMLTGLGRVVRTHGHLTVGDRALSGPNGRPDLQTTARFALAAASARRMKGEISDELAQAIEIAVIFCVANFGRGTPTTENTTHAFESIARIPECLDDAARTGVRSALADVEESGDPAVTKIVQCLIGGDVSFAGPRYNGLAAKLVASRAFQDATGLQNATWDTDEVLRVLADPGRARRVLHTAFDRRGLVALCDSTGVPEHSSLLDDDLIDQLLLVHDFPIPPREAELQRLAADIIRIELKLQNVIISLWTDPVELNKRRESIAASARATRSEPASWRDEWGTTYFSDYWSLLKPHVKSVAKYFPSVLGEADNDMQSRLASAHATLVAIRNFAFHPSLTSTPDIRRHIAGYMASIGKWFEDGLDRTLTATRTP